MKFAITSDLHYPITLAKQTVLFHNCRYSDAFYTTMEQTVRQLSPADLDALIINGDLAWDYRFLAPLPVIPKNWNSYNEHLYRLLDLRAWLHPEIELVLIEGNHDFWHSRSITESHGEAVFSKAAYRTTLQEHFKLNPEQISRVITALETDPRFPPSSDQIPIGSRIRLLKGKGIVIKDTYIYGFPFVEEDIHDPATRSMMQEFCHAFRTQIQDTSPAETIPSLETPSSTENAPLPLKTIICLHCPPATPNGFLHTIQDPTVAIKGIYWGHYHGCNQIYEWKYRLFGDYKCVMPERNHFRLVFRSV